MSSIVSANSELNKKIMTPTIRQRVIQVLNQLHTRYKQKHEFTPTSSASIQARLRNQYKIRLTQKAITEIIQEYKEKYVYKRASRNLTELEKQAAEKLYGLDGSIPKYDKGPTDDKIGLVYIETGFSNNAARIQSLLRNRHGLRLKQNTITNYIEARSTKKWRTFASRYARLFGPSEEAAEMADYEVERNRGIVRAEQIDKRLIARLGRERESLKRQYLDLVMEATGKDENYAQERFFKIFIESGDNRLRLLDERIPEIIKIYREHRGRTKRTFNFRDGGYKTVYEYKGQVDIPFACNDTATDKEAEEFMANNMYVIWNYDEAHALRMYKDLASHDKNDTVMYQFHSQSLYKSVPLNPLQPIIYWIRWDKRPSSQIGTVDNIYIDSSQEKKDSDPLNTISIKATMSVIHRTGGCRSTGKKGDREITFNNEVFIDPHSDKNNCFFSLVKHELDIMPRQTICNEIRKSVGLGVDTAIGPEKAIEIWKLRCKNTDTALFIRETATESEWISSDEYQSLVTLVLTNQHYYRLKGNAKPAKKKCDKCGKEYRFSHNQQWCMVRAAYRNQKVLNKEKEFMHMAFKEESASQNLTKMIMFDIESYSAPTKDPNITIQRGVALQWYDLEKQARFTEFRYNEDDEDVCVKFLRNYLWIIKGNEEKMRAMKAWVMELKAAELTRRWSEITIRQFGQRHRGKDKLIKKLWSEHRKENYERVQSIIVKRLEGMIKNPKNLRHLCAHNLSGYDGHMLKQACMQLGISWENELVRNNKILSATIGSTFKLWDFYLHLPKPLRSIPGAFKLQIRKGDLDYNRIKFVDDMPKEDVKAMLDYLDRDIDILVQAVPLYIAGMLEAVKIDPLKYPTSTGCSYRGGLRAVCNYGRDNDTDSSLYLPTWEEDKEFRAASFGGRVEVVHNVFQSDQFERYINGDCDYNGIDDYINSYDCNSLYPTAMCREFPIGAPMDTSEYKEGKLGIYFCTIIPNKRLVFSGHLQRMKMGLSGILEDCERWMCSTEIDFLRKELGYTINIQRGRYWEKSAPIFRDHIMTLYNRRKEAKKDGNKVLSELYKLLLNSLYGRFLLKPEHSATYTCYSSDSVLEACMNPDGSYRKLINQTFTDDDCGVILNVACPPKNGARASDPSQIGAFVLSHSKVIMYEAIYSLNKYSRDPKDGIYYMDTDCLVLNSKQAHKIEPFLGPDLGMFKAEMGEDLVPIDPNNKSNPPVKGKCIWSRYLLKKVYCSIWVPHPEFHCGDHCEQCKTKHRLHAKVSGKGLPLKELMKVNTAEDMMRLFDRIYNGGKFQKESFTFRDKLRKVGPKVSQKMRDLGVKAYDIVKLDTMKREICKTVNTSRVHCNDSKLVKVPEGYQEKVAFSKKALKTWFSANYNDKLTSRQMMADLQHHFTDVPGKRIIEQHVKKLIENM